MSEKGFRRNNFFSGRLLTAADLQLEQNYFREKQRLHNRALHGFGIVSGLEVSRRRDKLVITAGLALDCEGNEIVVPETHSHPLPQPEFGYFGFSDHSLSRDSNKPHARSQLLTNLLNPL